MIAEKRGAIGVMTFNNPDRFNVVYREMWEGVTEILADFGQDDTIRVVVVTGAGNKAFVSGADISKFQRRARVTRRYREVRRHRRCGL